MADGKKHQVSLDLTDGHVLVICDKEIVSLGEWPDTCPVCGAWLMPK